MTLGGCFTKFAAATTDDALPYLASDRQAILQTVF